MGSERIDMDGFIEILIGRYKVLKILQKKQNKNFFVVGSVFFFYLVAVIFIFCIFVFSTSRFLRPIKCTLYDSIFFSLLLYSTFHYFFFLSIIFFLCRRALCD